MGMFLCDDDLLGGIRAISYISIFVIIPKNILWKIGEGHTYLYSNQTKNMRCNHLMTCVSMPTPS